MRGKLLMNVEMSLLRQLICKFGAFRKLNGFVGIGGNVALPIFNPKLNFYSNLPTPYEVVDENKHNLINKGLSFFISTYFVQLFFYWLLVNLFSEFEGYIITVRLNLSTKIQTDITHNEFILSVRLNLT